MSAAICQDADLPHWFPSIAATLGAAYTLGGRVADAVPLLTQALEWAMAAESPPLADELGMRPLQAHCHWSFGTLYMRTGQ
jgi:hypothetical protein